MRQALALAILAALVPTAVTAHHDDAEAAVFDEFLAREQDSTQNALETATVGHETGWACPIRSLYFDLRLFAFRYWPSGPAQASAAAASALAYVHTDFCESADVEPLR